MSEPQLIDSFELESTRRTSQRKSLLGTIAQVDSTSAGAYCPHIDSIDVDMLESVRSVRSSIFNAHTENVIAKEHPEFHQALLNNTRVAMIIQGTLLFCTVVAYVAPPICINWAKTVGYTEEDSKPVKVDTFLGVSVVIFSKATVCIVSLCLAIYYDCIGGQGNKFVSMIFDLESLWKWTPIGAGYALGDVAEIMANGKVDAATYTVLSQSRLVGTAVALKIMLGKGRTTLQWSILSNVSIMLIAWQLTPNEFGAVKSKGNSAELTGYIFTVIKVFLSISMGVLSQKILHGSDMPIFIQMAHNCGAGFVCTVILAPILIFILKPAFGEPWTDSNGVRLGFFGGQPVPPGLPNAGELTGWSASTFVVLGLFVYRELFAVVCVKRFDSVVKNICNAVAMIVTYALSVLVLQDLVGNVVKAMFAVCICLEIVHYGMAEQPKT